VSEASYFFTWSSQKAALKIPLESAENFGFVSNGRTLTDMSSLSYQASFGLKNQKIIKEMTKQMQDFCLASPKNTFKLKEQVASKLSALASNNPSKKSRADYKVFFTQSGSESIENALKMSRQISGKKYILAQKNSYHGASLGALSVTGDWRNKSPLSLSQYTIRVPSPQDDPQAKQLALLIEQSKKKGIAAICLETITGGNGVFIPSKGWYKEVQRLCKENDIHLILDEVVCAAHRTGPFFGFQNYPLLKPDFICLAKALTGGYFPLGAVLVHKKLASYYDDNVLSCGLTNYAHPIGLAASKAVLKICTGEQFKSKLERNIRILTNFQKSILSLESVITVRQIGMLMAIELKHPITAEAFIKEGLFVAVQNKRPIIAPPLNMNSKLLKSSLKKVELLLRRIT